MPSMQFTFKSAVKSAVKAFTKSDPKAAAHSADVKAAKNPSSQFIWKIKDYNAWISNGCPINNSIVEIDLSSNPFRYNRQLTFLVSTIDNLPNLQKINLDNNAIKILPDSICNLSALKVLSVANNTLQEIPSEICTISTLEELDVSTNNISHVPASIGLLNNLKKLDVSQNNITNIPIEFGLALEELNVGGNPLETFDCAFNALKILVLSATNLKEIPACVWDITTLEEL
jgi:Leucine-rich repeat (LRR) protein